MRNESEEAEDTLQLGAFLDRLSPQARTKCEEYYGKRLRGSLLSLKKAAQRSLS